MKDKQKWLSMLKQELDRANKTASRIDDFIWNSPIYVTLAEEDKWLVKEQWYFMEMYRTSVNRLLKRKNIAADDLSNAAR